MADTAGAALLTPEQRWACPNCTTTDVTHERRPHTQMHPCAAFGGFLMPMVPAGLRCKVEAIEREDYLAGEDVRLTSEGRPIMAARTTRDDGTDVAVYAPTAYINLRRD